MNNNGGAKRTDSEASDTTIFSLLHAAHALEDRVENTLSHVGLSTPKYSVLSALVQAQQPVSLGDLAARLSCVKSNMTQLVDRLEKDGLVRRVANPDDRRCVRAEITELGREKQSAGAAEVDRLNDQFASAIEPKDRAAIERMLSALK
jgi:DNA-binding MarR family transcriptional regulator